MSYFVLPSPNVIDREYRPGHVGYSFNNYFRPGLIAKLKRRRFEKSLSLARNHFGGRALDFWLRRRHLSSFPC
jgi:hypothetical protein